MKCVRCSAEIPSQSQFCLRCGSPIHSASIIPGSMNTAPAVVSTRVNTRPLKIAAAVLLLIVAGLGAMLLKGQLAQKTGQTPTGKLVQAPGENQPIQLVQRPGEQTPINMVQRPAEQKPINVVQDPVDTAPPPADIIDYLAFLKKLEAAKQVLIRKQTGDALSLMAQAKGLSGSVDENDYNSTLGNISKNVNYSAEDWNQLSITLQQRTPPDSCRELHNRYYEHLGKIQALMVAVNDAMSKIQSDPSNALQALTQMQGKAGADADAMAAIADEALSNLCRRYHLHKDFDIKTDSGPSSLLR